MRKYKTKGMFVAMNDKFIIPKEYIKGKTCRTEIQELGEYFDPEKQVGSSTMPHKMNPITAERICGVARIVKSYVNAAMENNKIQRYRSI